MGNDHRPLPGELKEPSAALSSLVPRSAAVDRDQLMFLAGKMAAQTNLGPRSAARYLWKTATVVSTSAALVMAVLLVAQKPADIGTRSEVFAKKTNGQTEREDEPVKQPVPDSTAVAISVPSDTASSDGSPSNVAKTTDQPFFAKAPTARSQRLAIADWVQYRQDLLDGEEYRSSATPHIKTRMRVRSSSYGDFLRDSQESTAAPLDRWFGDGRET